MSHSASLRFILVTSSLFFAQQASAQTAALSCDAERKAIEAVPNKYKVQFDGVSQTGKDIEKDKPSDVGAVISVDAKVDWKEQHWILDLPTITMKTQKLVFGVPQVAVKDQKIIFDIVETYMAPTKVGQYPEFGPWGVKWSDIITDVPQFRTTRKEIVMGIPEFKWDDTTIIMDIPEFKMDRQDWYVKIPEITVTNVDAKLKQMKERGEALKTKADSLSKQQKIESASATSSLYSCLRSGVVSSIADVRVKFDESITKMQNGISQVRAAGMDPTKITNSDGTVINLVQKLNDLIANRDASTKKLETSIEQMNSSEREAVAKLSS